MTAPTGTFLTTSAIGNREDLSDVIYRISPTATPFLNLASKGKATNTTHEWQTQDLEAAVTTNAAAEGDNASGKTVTPTVRLQNRTQISTKTVVVSGTQQSSNPAGRKDEMGYQMSLSSLELKRDMESSACQSSVAVGGATRYTRGLLGFLADNVSKDAGTTVASYTNNGGLGTAISDSGTTRAFTESQVKSVLQLIYTAGGEPDTIMLPPAMKQTFSTFTGNATRMDKSEDGKLYSAIDIYVSDFGEIRAIPNRFQRSRDVFILQADKWAISYLRPFMTHDIAKTGDSDQKQIVVEWTVEGRAPKANGAIFDLA